MMGRRPASLAIEGLSAGYPRRQVIRDMTLGPIAAGHVTALVGPNAAGKSTLLLALMGLIGAAGMVRLGDRDLLRLSIAERATVAAFMPQALPQGVALTVLESVIAACRASPLGGPAIAGEALRRRAAATLDRLGVADIALEFLDRLSGGQRQLVGLAQALVREPQLLLLDEPTSALDLRHQVGVMTLVRALAAEGRTVIAVLHDLNLAMRWADRIVVLDRGAVYAVGTAAEALTPDVIAAVYGVEARVERCSRDRLHVIVDGVRARAANGRADAAGGKGG
jgi:iron complex transport system ATP-binding protein